MAVHEKVKCEQCGPFRGGVELPAKQQRVDGGLGWGTGHPLIIFGFIIHFFLLYIDLKKKKKDALKFGDFGLKWFHHIHDAQFFCSYYATMNSRRALFLVTFPPLYRM